MTTMTENTSAMAMNLINPFTVESPEKLSTAHIVQLFIEPYTRIDVVKQRKHTFIWGTRGSGKSMMLRYLEPQCQLLVHGSMDAYLRTNPAFLGVYCPCKEGYFNKTEMRLLEPLTVKILTEHMLNLYIAAKLVECLRTQFSADVFASESLQEFAGEVMRLFDALSISPSVNEVDGQINKDVDPLRWLQRLFVVENRKVNQFLLRNAIAKGTVSYDAATSSYHDFLLPFMQSIQQIAPLTGIPIYVMLDDANRLTKDQQTIINTWISNRDQEFVCFKVAAELAGYGTFRNSAIVSNQQDRGELQQYPDLSIEGGGWIEAPHDYSEVDVDELYTHSKSDYEKKVRLIANRRLKISEVSTKSIDDFLPADAAENALLIKIREETAREWEEVGRPGDKDDYVYRYATARLYQYLKDRKRKSYAGFSNMVHLSSGVIRSFLEPCYLMFDKCMSREASPNQESGPEKIKLIPIDVQDDVLRRYSEDFLFVEIEKIRKELPPEQWTKLEALSILLNSLGRLFYERLHDSNAREVRLFSFSIRGSVPTEIDEVLRLGTKYRYFQARTYSSKEGGGRERWYILNRRLCPAFQLDPTGFEGRISLTPNLLKIACENSEKFVRLRLRKLTGEGQLTLFELTEGEEQ